MNRPAPRTARLALAGIALAALAGSRAGGAAGREAGAARMVAIPAGTYRPFYPPSEQEREMPISAFRLDRTPVTNADFLRFVQKSPRWRRDRASRLFAERDYLAHWTGPESLGEAAPPDRPVTRVSWFAAKAYCEWRGARLPTEAEWEYVAAAGERSADARDDEAWQRRILDWYARPSASLGPVGAAAPNHFGVHDLHGLVWEWVLDFNSTLVSEDSRNAQDKDRMRFCGAGALNSRDTRDYASFMRIAFRNALLPQYTTSALGFRCAAPPEIRE